MAVFLCVFWITTLIFKTGADGICSEGFYYTHSQSTGRWYCEGCPENTYRNEDMDDYSCTPCQRGYYTPGGGYPYCGVCPAGYHTTQSGASCTQCPRNTYKPERNVYCIPCSPGYYTNTTGATRATDCKAPTTSPTVITTSTIVTSKSMTSGPDPRNSTSHDSLVTTTSVTRSETEGGTFEDSFLVPVLIGVAAFFAITCGILTVALCFVVSRNRKRFSVTKYHGDVCTDHTSSISLPETCPRHQSSVGHSLPQQQHQYDVNCPRQYHVLEPIQYDECEVTSVQSAAVTNGGTRTHNNDACNTNDQPEENHCEYSNTHNSHNAGTSNYDIANYDSKFDDVSKMAAVFSFSYSHLDVAGTDSYSCVNSNNSKQKSPRIDGYSHIQI